MDVSKLVFIFLGATALSLCACTRLKELVFIEGTDRYWLGSKVCLACGRDTQFESPCVDMYGASICKSCPQGEHNPYDFHVNTSCLKKKEFPSPVIGQPTVGEDIEAVQHIPHGWSGPIIQQPRILEVIVPTTRDDTPSTGIGLTGSIQGRNILLIVQFVNSIYLIAFHCM